PCEDLIHIVEPRECIHHRSGSLTRSQEVDVTDRFGHPAQRTRMIGSANAGNRTEALEEGSGNPYRDIDRDPARVAAGSLDGLEHVLFGLRREPLQPPESAISSRRHQLVETIDPELPVDDHRLLRAEARDRGHRTDARWDLSTQLFELWERARLQHASNLLGDRLPHVRDRADPGVIEVQELIREPT